MSDEATGSNETDVASSADFGQSTILDVLNMDCWRQILDLVPVEEVVRSERVSRHWQAIVHEYLRGVRGFNFAYDFGFTIFKNYCGYRVIKLNVVMNVKLDKMISKMAPYMVRVYINETDELIEKIAEYCSELEEITFDGLNDNYEDLNSVAKKCTKLKKMCFLFCRKLEDCYIESLFENGTIEELTINNSSRIHGNFLLKLGTTRLKYLALQKCQLKYEHLHSAVDSLRELRELHLDDLYYPIDVLQNINLLLEQTPQLQTLSLIGYQMKKTYDEKLTKALSTGVSKLTNLKNLYLRDNILVTDEFLEVVAESCPMLLTLDVSYCRPNVNFPKSDVTDVGVTAVCRGCSGLSSVRLAELPGVTDASLRALATCANLASLQLCENKNITNSALTACIYSCHVLELLDVRGCSQLSAELLSSVSRALDDHPRVLQILAARSDIMYREGLEKHKCLVLSFNDNSTMDPRAGHNDYDFDGDHNDYNSDRYFYNYGSDDDDTD